MMLKSVELLSVLLTALTGGMFWGPWLGLTISMRTFEPAVFLVLTDRLARNIGAVMTWLLPLALAGMLPVLVLSYAHRPATFYLTLAAFGFYLLALVVTMAIEVPLVKQMVRWTQATLPPDWQRVRDRWGAFHVVRVGSALLGLGLLVAGALAT